MDHAGLKTRKRPDNGRHETASRHDIGSPPAPAIWVTRPSVPAFHAAVAAATAAAAAAAAAADEPCGFQLLGLTPFPFGQIV
jgi:hypothetical protein